MEATSRQGHLPSGVFDRRKQEINHNKKEEKFWDLILIMEELVGDKKGSVLLR